jgi:CspA family cold shock protein
MRGLKEGQKIGYELQTDQRSGKQSAGNLRAV